MITAPWDESIEAFNKAWEESEAFEKECAEKVEAAAKAWREKWPNACPQCHGHGGVTTTQCHPYGSTTAYEDIFDTNVNDRPGRAPGSQTRARPLACQLQPKGNRHVILWTESHAP